MRALIYDCEIIKAIPPNGNEPLQDGIEYCSGWGDHANMGVSVIGAFDYDTDRYRVFCADNFHEFASLLSRSHLAVGFNNIGFDDKLLLGSGIIAFNDGPPRYDILAETWVAAGLSPTWSRASTHGGYGLNAICKATFGEAKTGDGANAAIAWQRGQIGTVIDYCIQDIRLTKGLFDRALAGTPIRDPKTMREIKLRVPTS